MYIDLGLMVALAVAVVLITHVVVSGLELYASAGGMSSKAKGQFLGYATSLPEMVGTVGTAGNGLIAAGLWNIASSNIINLSLFVAAASYHRRIAVVANRKFVDEVAFALMAFTIPLVLSQLSAISTSPFTAAGLFGFFLLYLFVDRRLNPEPPPSTTASRKDDPVTRRKALAITGTGILGIILAGNYLGAEAKIVVEGMGVPQWAVGWILGVITSLPEMTAFFAVFASARRQGLDPDDDTDCQENLDSLTASNMSNLGLIYPMGVAIFLLLGH